jgi:hypothetical protein
MQILIRRLSADGTAEEPFEGAEIVLGRGTDCTISLPGLLVALRHARLTQLSQYLLKVESLCPMGVELNGLAGVQSADVQVGDTLRIGGHRLRITVAREALAIEVELATGEELLSHGSARTGLAEAGLRMRRPALWLALVTLLLGFMIPFGLRWVEVPAAAEAALPTDRLWLTNGMDNAHQHFGADCAACHQALFVPVRDDACATCHQGMKHHSDNPSILKVAGLDGERCASCHREHQGAHGVIPRHPGICADCHGDPGRFTDFPDLQPVSDFATAHPEFRLTVSTLKDGKLETARVLQGEGVRDHAGLIFPHDVHLRAGGVRGPEGPEPLECASCHVRNRDEAHFERLSFEPHCQRCHQLDVDVNGTPVRLPHGDNELARTALLTYAKAPVPADEDGGRQPERRRPGDAAPRGGLASIDEIVDEVFENRVCAKCHEPVREPGKPIVARAPQLKQSWMVHARFTHDAHAWQACSDCHADMQSSSADDLSLPAIASCRTCHGGVDSSGRLQSTCIDCHRFHEASRQVMGALADGAEGSAGEQQKQ